MWLKSLASFRGIACTLRVLSDSSAARGMAGRLGLGRKAKHIAVQMLFIQDIIAKKEVALLPVASEANVADIGTKHLSRARLFDLMGRLGAEMFDPTGRLLNAVSSP